MALHDYSVKLSPGALLAFRLYLAMHASQGINPHRQAAAKWALARMNSVHGGPSLKESNEGCPKRRIDSQEGAASVAVRQLNGKLLRGELRETISRLA